MLNSHWRFLGGRGPVYAIIWQKMVTSGFGPFSIVVPTFLQHVEETKMIVATKEDGLVPPCPVHRMVPRARILSSQRTRHSTFPASAVTRISS
jgi:hypothetical protein